MRNITLLIESARRTTKMPIFYTAIEMLALKYESSAWLYTYNKLFARMQQQQQRSMSEKRDLSLAINRNEEEEEEMVITKHTASIFIGTYFERMIRNTWITTIIFSGIATERGVESSARRDLLHNSYKQIYDQQLINFLSFHCFRMIGYPESQCFSNHSLVLQYKSLRIFTIKR